MSLFSHRVFSPTPDKEMLRDRVTGHDRHVNTSRVGPCSHPLQVFKGRPYLPISQFLSYFDCSLLIGISENGRLVSAEITSQKPVSSAAFLPIVTFLWDLQLRPGTSRAFWLIYRIWHQSSILLVV